MANTDAPSTAAPGAAAGACCSRLLELAGRAQALAARAQGLFYGCYNQKIYDAVCHSLARALTIVQNHTEHCKICMKHVYDCICDTIQIKQ